MSEENMEKRVSAEYLPSQVIRTAQERYVREFPTSPWFVNRPNYQTILEEEHEKWRAKNEF
jgi:hypothetical protein